MLGGEEERSKAADVGVTGEAKGAGMGEGALPSRSEGGLTAVGPQVTDSEAGGVVEEVPFGRGLSWWEERQAQEGHKASEAQEGHMAREAQEGHMAREAQEEHMALEAQEGHMAREAGPAEAVHKTREAEEVPEAREAREAEEVHAVRRAEEEVHEVREVKEVYEAREVHEAYAAREGKEADEERRRVVEADGKAKRGLLAEADGMHRSGKEVVGGSGVATGNEERRLEGGEREQEEGESARTCDGESQVKAAVCVEGVGDTTSAGRVAGSPSSAGSSQEYIDRLEGVESWSQSRQGSVASRDGRSYDFARAAR